MKINIEIKDAKYRIEDENLNNCLAVLDRILGPSKTTATLTTPTVTTHTPIKPKVEVKPVITTRETNESLKGKSIPRSLPTYEQPEKVDKLIVFRCDKCKDTAVVYTDPNKPTTCKKCGEVHSFEISLKSAKYNCECGKICRFVMEESVSAVKCHTCGKDHHMSWSSQENCYISLDSIMSSNEKQERLSNKDVFNKFN